MRAHKYLTLISVALAALCVSALTAQAQWSIGPPGPRIAAPGTNRYTFLVFANPIPGQETEFNEWYQNVHMGDLVSLPGWTGAQRFRLFKDVKPYGPQDVYNRYGYVVFWDQQGNDADVLHAETNTGNAGGKIRRGTGFDYTGGGLSAYYQVLGPRVTRPDGKKPFIPDEQDYKTPRPDRYIVMDYSNPAAGVKDADYISSLNRRITQVLAVPGWMAAQAFRLVPPANAKPGSIPLGKYLIIWEIEGKAQAANDALKDATDKGAIQAVNAEPGSQRAAFWMPISPYVNRDDFQR